MSTVAAARPAAATIGRSAIVGLVAGLAAGVANLLVYFITAALFSLPYLVPAGGPGTEPAPLPIFAIVAACAIPGLLAGILYWALGRFTSRATTIFTVVAIAFALISLGGPLTLPIDLGTRLALAAMHIVAAAIITLGLFRGAPQS